MERPNVKNQPRKREVTGEIVYLDLVRRMGEIPKKFDDLSEMAIDMYSNDAGFYESQGKRPEIMDLYEEYDPRISDVETSCIALADELLALKEKDDSWTFIDLCVDKPAADVLHRLQTIKAGELLTGDDEQLAIKSNGEYYPILDMRKSQADLAGVGLRVWGWDHEKYVFTDIDAEKKAPKRDYLTYPADEKLAQRQFEINFIYASHSAAKDGSDQFSESISLTISESGGSSLSRSISSMVYAETGYEGHNHATLKDIQESDIAAFGDLVAEIVGDNPESISMRQDRELAEMMNAMVSEAAKGIAQELIDKMWPAQARFILRLRPKGSKKRLAEMLQSEADAPQAIESLRRYIDGQKS